MRAMWLPVWMVAASACLAQTETSTPLRVTAVRSWALGETTRVAIEVTGDFEYRSERLHNPDRVFFDISGARPYFNGKRAYSEELGGKLLTRVRVAETVPGVTRIVLDVRSPVDFTASQLSNPNRLIIEIREASQEVTPTLETPPVLKPDGPREPARLPPPPLLRTDPALAAERAASGSGSLIRALGLKISRVVIDPGHGGHDHGTAGPQGLTEKDLVLDLALRLGKLIEERMGAEVVYTRTDDTFVPLEGRTALANEKRADLFISLHANSSPRTEIAGVETFYLNFTSSQDALDLAARENAVSEKSIHELQDVIQRITLTEKIEESKEFANRIQSSLYVFSSRYSPGIKNRGVKKAPFIVLVGASMPSILVEVGFLSNRREETLFKRMEHRRRVAEALYRGLSRYASSLSHFQVAAAKP